jgi:transcriptional regulator with XRE-family HTH domain
MAVLDRTPAQAIDRAMRDFGLSDRDISQVVGASSRTIARWRSGEAFPQRESRQRLAELVALDERLRETFSTVEAIRSWAHAPSRYLGGITPAEAMRVGRIDRVNAALEALDSGIFV